jgi:hypothetical protein
MGNGLLSWTDGHASWSERGAGDRDRTGMAPAWKPGYLAVSLHGHNLRYVNRVPRQAIDFIGARTTSQEALPEKHGRNSVGRSYRVSRVLALGCAVRLLAVVHRVESRPQMQAGVGRRAAPDCSVVVASGCL